MANQLILGRALDANGYIAPGAKAAIYADGTSTLISVYSDSAGTVAATNPIVADADGFWPQRFVTEDAKAVVTTSADVALYTLDPAPAVQGTGAAASQVSFSPRSNCRRPTCRTPLSRRRTWLCPVLQRMASASPGTRPCLPISMLQEPGRASIALTALRLARSPRALPQAILG